MTDTVIETLPAKPRRWQLSNVVLIPFYLMAIGFLLRYAVYVRTSGHWGMLEYIRALCVYDCNAYERLALYGYEDRPDGFDKGDANNWAFFPTYSMLVWAISQVTSLSVLLAGTILTNLLTVASAIVAWPLFEGKTRAYFLFCFALFLGPFSYYFTTLYTEGLFLLLTVAGFVLLRQRDYMTAGFTGALMSATRSTGLVFAAAILIQGLQDHLRDGGSLGSFIRSIFRRTDLILAVAMVPVGLCIFALYMYFLTGDALAFVHIQRAWGRAFQNPFSNLWIALTLQFKNGWQLPIITTDLAFGIAAIIGFILCIVLAIRRQWAMAVFCLAGILLPLSTNTYSMIRFVVGLAPLLIISSILLAHWKWLYYLVLPALLIFDVLFLQTWISRSYYLM